MTEPLIDLWTKALHEEFTEHPDPKSGLPQDCKRCREMAMALFRIQTDKLIEVFNFGKLVVNCDA